LWFFVGFIFLYKPPKNTPRQPTTNNQQPTTHVNPQH